MGLLGFINTGLWDHSMVWIGRVLKDGLVRAALPMAGMGRGPPVLSQNPRQPSEPFCPTPAVRCALSCRSAGCGPGIALSQALEASKWSLALFYLVVVIETGKTGPWFMSGDKAGTVCFFLVPRETAGSFQWMGKSCPVGNTEHPTPEFGGPQHQVPCHCDGELGFPASTWWTGAALTKAKGALHFMEVTEWCLSARWVRGCAGSCMPSVFPGTSSQLSNCLPFNGWNVP